MTRPRKHSLNEQTILSQDSDWNTIKQYELQSLPSSTLTNKQDLIRFCFLLLLLQDDLVRKAINKSRITIQFWTEFRILEDFQKTFINFSDKELLNVFKYIYFFPVHKHFSPYLTVKAYLYLSSSNSLAWDLSLADLGKEIMIFLKKLTRKNSRLFNSNIFDEINLKQYYNQQHENTSLLKLYSNNLNE